MPDQPLRRIFAPKGRTPPPSVRSSNSEYSDSDIVPIGTGLSEYAGPENAPFKCGNCLFFDEDGTCDHPVVVADPEVPGAKVDAEGCCRYFRKGKDAENGVASLGPSEPEAPASPLVARAGV